ncbi:MAG: outer membrane protein nutrient binding [Ferruginibacter sp.]|nr:outer membrane protein nutrient binding [Ferruginibacter sp.]
MKFKDLIRFRHSACLSNSIVRIMKLTVLIMTTFLLQVSAAGMAQEVTFTKKDVSLKQLFTEIRKQTGYNVFWQEDKVNEDLKVNANFVKAPLEDVLNNVLDPQLLTYTIVNKTVVVKKKEANFLNKVKTFFFSLNIDGKVLDAETGKPIPGVTIALKGTNRLVVADAQGHFTFKSLPDSAVLIVSSVGYQSAVVKASDNLVVKLTTAVQKLEEVVVSNGYQQMKRESTTGSYNVITAKDIESTPSLNLMERLEGKVPGVMFDLRNNTIQIRGVNDYSNSTPPLIVIDGFPAIDQNITNITSGTVIGSQASTQPLTSGNAILSTFNPADIESITFLKDAAASSIWGSKAANGVIVITTKKGKKGTATININSTVSISAPANFSNMTSMTSAQYINLEQELFNKGFLTDPNSYYRFAPISEAEDWMFRVKRGTATATQRDSALNVLSNRSNVSQLKQYLLQRAVTKQNNLSLSGGGDNSSYYISGNYSDDVPVFKSNYAQNYSLNSNLTNDFLNKRITVTTGMNYSYSKSQVNGAALSALGFGPFGFTPYQMLVDNNGNSINRPVTFTSRVSDSLQKIGYMPWTYNTLDELNYNNTINDKYTFRINGAIKGTVTNWLYLTVSGQLQKAIADQGRLQNLDSYATRSLINTGTTFTNGIATYGVPVGAVDYTSNTNTDDYSLRAQFNINKSWQDQRFEMIGGTEIRQTKFEGSSQTRYGYNEYLSTSVVVNPTVPYKTIYGSTTTLGYSDGTIYLNTQRYLSYYSNASYSLFDKFYATGSIRFDDYSMIGVDRSKRAIPLWSAGLRWDLKKETFMKDINWISALSLRGTYGAGGNVPTNGVAFTTINVSSTDLLTHLPVSTIISPGDPNLGWETTTTTNGGIDATLFGNRLNLTVDAYHKHTNGILWGLPINPTYGWTNLIYNAGNLTGHGIEVNLTGQVVQTKNWNWTSNFNFSYNTNDVTDTNFPHTTTTVGSPIPTTGYPTDGFFVYRWAGLDNKGQSQIYAANGSIISSTSATTVKPQDLTYAGRSTPPYFGGFTNTVRYKDFSLSTRITYYLGNKFLLNNLDQSFYPQGSSFSGYLSNSEVLAQRWEKPGDEATTNVPGLSNINLNSIQRYMYSDLNVRNGGNIRFQQISLNYTVPKKLLQRTKCIKALSVGTTVSNLGLLWVANKEGIDPNYQMTSQYNNLPPSRTYVLNLNLSL